MMLFWCRRTSAAMPSLDILLFSQGKPWASTVGCPVSNLLPWPSGHRVNLNINLNINIIQTIQTSTVGAGSDFCTSKRVVHDGETSIGGGHFTPAKALLRRWHRHSSHTLVTPARRRWRLIQKRPKYESWGHLLVIWGISGKSIESWENEWKWLNIASVAHSHDHSPDALLLSSLFVFLVLHQRIVGKWGFHKWEYPKWMVYDGKSY